ncbi:DNA-3-methyladenine glycosylase family protein [Ureibacillus acetophenoni]|uniref:DNA-3-methyladenine glycosylase II n=1 Tax=Ureibacillus acetophenoni TaxID=614649 RepID=A0A285UMU6_9BACL|nr:DNA-3-methyladenine glycosylase [Ureibacillus acetophenoni]SOC43235.1 DNA-3-methyladenine glycosylase II [Ureibacillus acetophenoni]
MNWIDHKSYIEICPPQEFNFEECLVFLGRANHEILHQIKEGVVYKLLKVNDSLVLFTLKNVDESIKVEFPLGPPSIVERKKVGEYVWEWFDLDQDLGEFYRLASRDKVLKMLVQKYEGLRIMCIPDLFEALVWAVMGQQINLTFAYTLKKRFVEQFGESITFEGDEFWVFPSFEEIATLSVEDLTKLQISTRKAEYIIGIAKEMVTRKLSKELLLQREDYNEMKKSLMSIRGIGAWTADYVLMKCLHEATAFPIADVGLHNGLKNVLGLEKKPSIEEIEGYAAGWKGWQAYATFYLWRSLYDENI